MIYSLVGVTSDPCSQGPILQKNLLQLVLIADNIDNLSKDDKDFMETKFQPPYYH